MVTGLIRKMTLSGRLSLYLGAFWLIFSAVLAGFTHVGVKHMLAAADRNMAEGLANQVALVSVDAMLLQDYALVERLVMEMASRPHIAGVRVQRADGEVIAQAHGAAREAADNDRGVLAAAEIELLDREVGAVQVRYQREGGDAAALRFTLAGLAIAFLMSLGLFLWLRWILARRLIGPVARLAEGVSPIRPLPPVDAGAPREVQELAGSFERMREDIRAHIDAREEANRLAQSATRQMIRDQQLVAVGQLSAGLAHGMNTPLGNIVGYCQLVRERLPAESAGLGEWLDVIERQARSCSDIVANLLRVSRSPTLRAEPIELDDEVRRSIDMLRPHMNEQGVRRVHWQGCPGEWVLGDAGAIEHVLFNLLNNAAQAGGRDIVMHGEVWGDFLDLVVEDDGPGIDASMRDRLFEPFVSGKAAGVGNGLGLYMSKVLMNALDGEIEVAESRNGARFVLSFRRVDDRSRQAERGDAR